MENNSILFVVPTIMNRPGFEINNIESVAEEMPNQRFLFICNTEDDDFTAYHPMVDNVEKHISGTPYSISHALNYGANQINGEKYFCFLQSDVFINKSAIEDIRYLCDDPSMNTGVIGITKHSNYSPYGRRLGIYFNLNVHHVLWADGIMFFSTSLFDKISYFNTEYVGDKESQEFCYRAHDAGFNNYYVETTNSKQSWFHKSLTFPQKPKNDTSSYQELRKKSVELFSKTWHPWEPTQKYRFED